MNNENKFEIESKLYVTPSKGISVFKIFLNIIIVVQSIALIISTVCGDFSFSQLVRLGCVIGIVQAYNARNKSNYQYAMLSMSVLEPGINLIYHNVKKSKKYYDMDIKINRNEIKKIEKNNDLNAIRIVAPVKLSYSGKHELLKEWIIYLNEDTQKVAKVLESSYQLQVINV